MGDIVQIIPADGWWALYEHDTRAERQPLIAWVLLDNGTITGIIEGDGPTPVTACRPRPTNFAGYYRSGQRTCSDALHTSKNSRARGPGSAFPTRMATAPALIGRLTANLTANRLN